MDSEGKRKTSLWGILLTGYGAVSTYIYFQGGFGFFITAYILTVASVAVTSARHFLHSEVKQKTLPFIIGGLGFYIGGALLLWAPEQIFCGNRIHDSHHTVPK